MEAPRRWGRVVDVVDGGVLYTEDAERLFLVGVQLSDDQQRRSDGQTYLMELVHDKIVFYEVEGEDRLGRLAAQVWVGVVHVNAAMRARGFD